MNADILRSGFGKKKTVLIAAAAIIVAGAAYFFIAGRNGGKYQFVAVTKGTITQIVSVTGNTTPVNSVDLSFPLGGTIAGVYKNAGENVAAGDILAKLDTSALEAQKAQAQAQVDAAQAQLENLQAGSTPQDVQVSNAAVAAAEQTLANAYSSVPNAIMDAYAKANDAVRNQIAIFYANADTSNPQLAFQVSDSQTSNTASAQRVQVGGELDTWAAQTAIFSSTTIALPTSTLESALAEAAAHLSVVGNMLNTDATAIVNAIGLSASSSAVYKNAVANAITEESSASTAINSLQQDIASERASVAQAKAQLEVTLAGSTPQAIAAQEASVAQAKASVENINVEIANSSLVSPINGVVTVENAKVGEVAIAGQVMTSIISANNLEVDAYVPETDIGKISLNDPVDMTFDAFPGETFKGTVFYIDPAQTIQSGVVDYLVKVSFDAKDARIKSGLTANLDIKTETVTNALILPQYAVIQNASGTFIDILKNGAETQVPVTLGIRDENGNVEILTGASEGEEVINVGLKG